ncbi:hypothetical protein EYF80_007311 [Liparis tanakae]|uniref:Uncharacterized protein n=1 Tax=Liparis tanakae TaxID=230148 RepID=A0A4Z2IX75_9TELE|nr:hypothetical protein EYF80_007311 [Liparis tanakae]
MRRTASRSSSSASILISSSRASFTRSRSLLSTTKIKPRMVVFPAASSPTMRILISFLPIRLFNRLPKMFPMMTGVSHLNCNTTVTQGGN